MTDPTELAFYRQMGARIRELRGSMRQEDLAGAVGMTRTSLVNIEAGRQRILVHNLLEIAKALGVSTSDLMLPFEGNLLKTEPVVVRGPGDKTEEATRWVGATLARLIHSKSHS